ncbi:Crp/Fnr family transcriptional regulator [uncultured Aquimarina sp.]|uniref:Crp/Fnr family transcriptional regulator n=1 Tax=uncultured Aquimarina sp. TaxID=575652 RepID=UPI0026220BBE|nr:Crp/Fnr family transcriptional regulator [uncultured Aquimarina sp.]
MINTLFPHKRYSFINEFVLKDLPDKDFNFIQDKSTVLKLKKGQAIFHEGTTPIGLYIIRIGKIKKYATGLNGKEHIFYLAKEGEIIGHHELISEETYSSSAACLTDSIVNLIPKDVFFKILEDNPNIKNRLLRSISHEFGVFINNSRILAQHSVRERCAISIIKLQEFFSIKEGGGFRISRKDHSNIVGTSVESLVRVLHDFKKENVIKVSENLIFIIDIKKLVEICNLI